MLNTRSFISPVVPRGKVQKAHRNFGPRCPAVAGAAATPLSDLCPTNPSGVALSTLRSATEDGRFPPHAKCADLQLGLVLAFLLPMCAGSLGAFEAVPLKPYPQKFRTFHSLSDTQVPAE